MAARILVVDDEALQLKVSRLYFEGAGYVVDTATSADEALALARVARPDLIVSDVLMGEIDGFGLCRRLHDDTMLGRIPVVLVSSHYGADDAHLACAVGAVRLVERTPDFAAELAAVRDCLAAHHAPRTRRPSAQAYEEHLRATANQLSRMNQRAQRADERFRILLDEAHDAIAVFTTDGILLDANRRCRDLFGVEPATLVGKHVRHFAPPGAADANEAMFRRGVAAGTLVEAGALANQATGEVLHVEFTLKVVAVDGESQVLVIGRDITAQQEATRRLVEAEAMYRSLIERMPDVVWRMRGDGAFLFVSPNVHAITGLRADDLLRDGRTLWLDHVHPEDARALAAALATATTDLRPYECEYRFVRPGGRTIWLHSRVAVTASPDGVIFEGLAADVTARRELEHSLAQAQKLEAIGQLAGGIAHDFNNLLTVILSTSGFLTEELPLGHPSRADAEEIGEAARRAAALTRQLLAFSRRQPLALTEVDSNAIVTGLGKMLRRLIGEDIALSLATSPEVGRVRADPAQLEQVIVNLVVNARDAMPGGGHLSIETRRATVAAGERSGLAPGDYTVLAVRDDGVGMSADVASRIFEPFFTTKPRGTAPDSGWRPATASSTRWAAASW